jgi:cob(I)alamin adenosyltransferase
MCGGFVFVYKPHILRRADRLMGAPARAGALDDSAALRYVNRASDLLFAMARFADEPDPELFEGRGRSADKAS